MEKQASLTLLNLLLDLFSRQELDDIKKLVQTPSNFMMDAAEWGKYEFLVKVIIFDPWTSMGNRYKQLFHIPHWDSKPS